MVDATGRPSRGDDTRTRILNAARELFASDGFDATTVRDIAQKVGLTDAALYYHFKNKREILNAVWDVPMGRGGGAFRPDGPLDRERLDAITDSAMEFTIRNEQLLRLMSLEILNGDETALALREQNRAVLRRVFREHFLTITTDGDSDVRTEAAVAVITGASMKLQMESGSGFVEAADRREFRERVRRWVRRVGGLEPAPV